MILIVAKPLICESWQEHSPQKENEHAACFRAGVNRQCQVAAVVSCTVDVKDGDSRFAEQN